MTAAKPLSPIGRAALSVVRATPLCRGRSRKVILQMIKQRVHDPIEADYRGIPFIFNLDNTTEAKALFGRYNIEEINFMQSCVADVPSAVFVDLGANSGFYMQNFLGRGHDRLALAIEPNPSLCQRVRNNFALLSGRRPDHNNRLIVECAAVGASAGSVHLDVSQGLGCAQIVQQATDQTIPVKMDSLHAILKRNDIQKIDLMKIDIEGYEDRAVVPFFEQAEAALFPRHIIFEHTSSDMWENDLFAVLHDNGYEPVGKTRGNLLLTRR